jgi:hypothetical protein
MRGSVIKKGDRWYVKIELDPDPATGKRTQVSTQSARPSGHGSICCRSSIAASTSSRRSRRSPSTWLSG